MKDWNCQYLATIFKLAAAHELKIWPRAWRSTHVESIPTYDSIMAGPSRVTHAVVGFLLATRFSLALTLSRVGRLWGRRQVCQRDGYLEESHTI
jgi:hypothetical protein